jgi:hypothetical protein
MPYSKTGRLLYDPELHAKQGTPWMLADQKFLIDNYTALGAEACGLALERTTATVMTRVCELRRTGLMPKFEKGSKRRRNAHRQQGATA